MRLIDIAPCEHHGHAMVLFATEDGKLCQCRSCDIPTIEAEPVKHGRWVKPYINFYGHPCHCCSECGFKASYQDKNYCPNCGAKMDGGE